MTYLPEQPPARGGGPFYPEGLLEECEKQFDKIIEKFRYVNDVITEASKHECASSESVFDDIFEVAAKTYGYDETEVDQRGAAYIDGALLAMMAADVFADNMHVDPAAYRIRLRKLLETGMEEALLANGNLYTQVYSAFQESCDQLLEVAQSNSSDEVSDGFNSTFTMAIHAILQAKAASELLGAVKTINDTSELDELAALSASDTFGSYPEAIPEGYETLFDPLSEIDPTLVSEYMLGRLFSGESVKREVRYLHVFQEHVRPELVNRLIHIGKYLEPYDDELSSTDEDATRLRSFNSGMAIALGLIDIISMEVRGTRSRWGGEWRELSPAYDSPLMSISDIPSDPMECFQIGQRIMQIGDRLWDRLPDEYKRMIETVEGELESTAMHPHIFHASFAYVFFFGREVLADITLEEKEDDYIQGMAPRDEYFEAERALFFDDQL